MAERYLRQSPLFHLHLAARAADERGEDGVVLAEQPFRGMVNLRGDAGADAFRAAVETASGVGVPTEPNTVERNGSAVMLWLGPDEWLLDVGDDSGAEATFALRDALKDQWAAVTEVGESMTVVVVSGPRARDVLAKGCSLDLHPRVFTPGRCAQTLLAKADVVMHLVDDGPRFELYVRRSFAEYVWLWLEDAGLEYGVAIMEHG